jgi:hypothetical protein
MTPTHELQYSKHNITAKHCGIGGKPQAAAHRQRQNSAYFDKFMWEGHPSLEPTNRQFNSIWNYYVRFIVMHIYTTSHHYVIIYYQITAFNNKYNNDNVTINSFG